MRLTDTQQNALHRLDRDQLGLIWTPQATRIGLSRAQIRTFHAARDRRAVGVSANRSVRPTWEQALLVPILAHGDEPYGLGRRPSAMGSGPSAARIRELPGGRDDRLHVLTVYARKVRQPGVVGHRSRLVVPADRTVVGGVPVTSAARTIVDNSARGDLSDRDLLRWIDELVRRGETDIETIVHCVQRLPDAPGRSQARLLRLLDARGDRQVGDSLPEVSVADWMQRAGYERPELGIEIDLGDGTVLRIDGGWRPERVGFEYQSNQHHRGDLVLKAEEDDLRMNLLRFLGWDLSPVRPNMRPSQVVPVLGGAIEIRRRHPMPFRPVSEIPVDLRSRRTFV